MVEDPSSRLPPILSLVGGKWTSFRAFAEQVTDRVLLRLSKNRKTSTADRPIGGGRDYPANPSDRARWLDRLHRETQLPPDTLADLFDRYGTRSDRIAEFILQLQPQDQSWLRLVPETNISRGEIAFLIQHESVQFPADLLMRRTMLGKQGRATPAIADEIADIKQSLELRGGFDE